MAASNFLCICFCFSYNFKLNNYLSIDQRFFGFPVSKPKSIIGNTWKATFSTLDANNNGMVSEEELITATLQQKVQVSF